MANNITKQSGRVEREDGSYVNWADIQLACIRSGSRVGSIEVSPTATPVFADSQKLDKRHEVFVFNDASAFVYWAFKANPVIGQETMPIPSGGMMKFKYDPNDPQDVYLVTSGLTTTVKVIELK